MKKSIVAAFLMFFRADLKVSIVVAFLMCSGRVPDRRTKVKETMITFCLALIEWNFEEAEVGTGAKRSRRRVQK